MNISSTRKVSSSSSPLKRTGRNYAIGAEGHPFVENIDTRNNVLVKDEADKQNKKNSDFAEQKKEEKNTGISSSQAYVSALALEVLGASDIYNENDTIERTQSYQNKQVNVYDNNQSMVQDERDSSADNPYLKHLYEKNKILEDIDELV